MITVFGRNYYGAVGCNYSGYSAVFDGVNQYVQGNAGNHFMGLASLGSGSGGNKIIISAWVKQDWTFANAGSGIKFMMSQNATGIGGGSTDQFFRLAYGAKTGAGANSNKLYVTYRGDGTSNMIERVYDLHANTSVTGSTSASDWWTSDNSNIQTNTNGFVHLCVIMNLPDQGIPFGFGSIDTYWNGELLTNSTLNASGVGQNDSNSVYSLLGTNISNLAGFFHGKLDEIQVTSDLFGMTTALMSAYSLTTNQDIADFFWNDGCPVDTASDPNASSWNWYNYRFENNWDSENTNPYTMTPVNGTPFSTDHA